jgi:hypothetical protein
MAIPDGFVMLDGVDRTELGLNLDSSLNELSAFADPPLIAPISDRIMVDRHYGLVYTEMELLPVAVYGKTDDLPAYSGDELANYGFLRVPFRRIPRRIVHSRKDVESIVGSIHSADTKLRILYRGQCREYLIERTSETSQWLYGVESVLEPSLAASASRRKPGLESVMPEWCALLKVFIDTYKIPVNHEFLTDGTFRLFALALAQHYGLPTSGLDVTDRLEIGLYFALMQYQKAAGSPEAAYTYRDRTAAMPVLYILAPAENQQFDYEQYRPEGFPTGRPTAQSAFFMHTGWGHAENLCASRIFLALYLDPDGDFGPIPAPNELFPLGGDDLFATFLTEMMQRKLGGPLDRVLAEGFYTVAP